ncbi:MAG: magnesium transporter [Candidatus Hydrothermarchaeota archaeon]
MISAKKYLKEGLPIILLCLTLELVAGNSLSHMQKEIVSVPGLLVLLPPVMCIRGNIYGSLGSRLTTSLHLGLIDPSVWRSKVLNVNIYASLSQTLFMSIFVGIFAHYACLLLNLPSAGILTLILISLIAGIVSGFFLTFLAIFISFFGYSHGLNPDNFIAPLLATIGDIITVFSLFPAIWLVRVL